MELTLENVLSSKIFVKENSAIDFKKPEEYISPFIEAMSSITDKFSVRAERASINAEETGQLNESFSRVLIEAKFPEDKNIVGVDDWLSFSPTIGLVYALDLQKPIMKIYTGENVKACTNLTIWNAENVYQQELLGNIETVYKKARDYRDNIDKELEEFLKSLNILTSRVYEGQEINTVIGKLLEGGIKNPKLGHSVIVQAAKDLYDKKSIYSIKDNKATAWHIYNSITEQLKKSDIIDRPTKTALLSSLMLKETQN